MQTNTRRLAAALLFAIIFLSSQPASVSAYGKQERSSFQSPQVESTRQLRRMARKKRSPNSVSRSRASSAPTTGRVASSKGRQAARTERERGGNRGIARAGTDSGGREGAETQVGRGQVQVGPIEKAPVNPQDKSAAAPRASGVMAPPTKPKPVH